MDDMERFYRDSSDDPRLRPFVDLLARAFQYLEQNQRVARRGVIPRSFRMNHAEVSALIEGTELLLTNLPAAKSENCPACKAQGARGTHHLCDVGS